MTQQQIQYRKASKAQQIEHGENFIKASVSLRSAHFHHCRKPYRKKYHHLQLLIPRNLYFIYWKMSLQLLRRQSVLRVSVVLWLSHIQTLMWYDQAIVAKSDWSGGQ